MKFNLISQNDSVYTKHGITVTIGDEEWWKWEDENWRRMTNVGQGKYYDCDEAREIGIISPEHLNEVFNFLTK